MLKLNNKGSILQIVLTLFIIMTFALTTCLFMMKSKVSNYYNVDLLMKQKNLEILLLHYYADQIENDILLSDSYENEYYDISYTVDDLGDLYEITTQIESKNMNYTFLVDITTDTYVVKKFEYLEE